jgi:hypothetical protein
MSSPVTYLRPEQLRLDLGVRDLSEPAEGRHAMQILTDRAVAALSRAWTARFAGAAARASCRSPTTTTGSATRPRRSLGMGLDRLLMLAKRIPDIRLLRSGDPRVAGQMLDLAPYRPVSSMPAITRDLSIAVADDDDEETLGDRVRDALGADSRRVEEVRVVAATTYRKLPARAIARLGARL